MIFSQRQDISDGVRGVLSRLGDAVQEEDEPGLPFAPVPYGLKPFIILLSPLLQRQGNIEHRLAQHLILAEQEGDQQPPQSAVPVHKGMNGFELRVRQSDADQQRQVRRRMQKTLQVGHVIAHRFRGRRHKDRVGQGGVRRADPVLSGSELAGRSVPAPDVQHQTAMDFAEQSRR
ncbi:hypothetical protein D3C77_516260 [compost metagenome]